MSHKLIFRPWYIITHPDIIINLFMLCGVVCGGDSDHQYCNSLGIGIDVGLVVGFAIYPPTGVCLRYQHTCTYVQVDSHAIDPCATIHIDPKATAIPRQSTAAWRTLCTHMPACLPTPHSHMLHVCLCHVDECTTDALLGLLHLRLRVS